MKFYITVCICGILSFSCKNKTAINDVQTAATIVKLNSSSANSIRGISVLDSNIIWVSGAKGTILKTDDGGNHWEVLPSPDEDSLDYRSIKAFDNEKALIVSAGFPARVYMTTNSGLIWDLVYQNKDSAAFMNSIAFKNNQEGIIVGDQLGKRHLILKTEDGGYSWDRLDSSGIPIPLANENGFAASGTCIAVKDDVYFIGLGGGHSRVFSSKDGINWAVNESKLATSKYTSGIYSIVAGKEYLMAVGGDYTEVDSMHQAVISKNGKDWEQTKGFLKGYKSIVDYSKTCDCWLAAGTNGIEVSFNNGASWEKISDKDINTLSFAPFTNRAFLANKRGEIFTLDISSP